jgi:prolactin regulatory element-binding protein
LASDEDNPTSLDVADGNIYAGINRSTSAIKEKKNSHLRVFHYKTAKDRPPTKASYQLFDSGDVDEYQKCTSVSSNGLLAVSSSLVPGSVYVLSLGDLKTRLYVNTLDSKSINDIHFSPNGERLAYISDTKMYIVEASSGQERLIVDSPRKDVSLAKIRFVSDSEVVVAANVAKRKGVFLYKYDCITGKRIAAKSVNKTKALTCLDAGSKYIVLGSSDSGIVIVSTGSLATLKKVDKVHGFAVTSICLNPAQTRIASTSVSGTVHLLELPDNGIFNGGIASIVYALYSVVLIALLAVVLHFVMKRQMFDDLVSYTTSRARSIALPTFDHNTPLQEPMFNTGPVGEAGQQMTAEYKEYFYSEDSPEGSQKYKPELSSEK